MLTLYEQWMIEDALESDIVQIVDSAANDGFGFQIDNYFCYIRRNNKNLPRITATEYLEQTTLEDSAADIVQAINELPSDDEYRKCVLTLYGQRHLFDNQYGNYAQSEAEPTNMVIEDWMVYKGLKRGFIRILDQQGYTKPLLKIGNFISPLFTQKDFPYPLKASEYCAKATLEEAIKEIQDDLRQLQDADLYQYLYYYWYLVDRDICPDRKETFAGTLKSATMRSELSKKLYLVIPSDDSTPSGRGPRDSSEFTKKKKPEQSIHLPLP